MSENQLLSFWITPIIVTIFALLFMVFVFLLIKLWFEINRFQKIENIIQEMEFFKSQFFLNKLNEIRYLALKNKKYQSVFVYFYRYYHRLFTVELRDILNSFLKNFGKENTSNNLIIETKEQAIVLQHFEKLKFEIEKLNNELNAISSWENFCLNQISFFQLILEKTEEEIAKAKMTVNFDFDKVKIKIQEQSRKINYFSENISDNLQNENLNKLKDLSKTIPSFVQQILIWLKVVIFFRVSLPNQQQKLLELIQNSFRLDKVHIVRELSRNFKEEMIEIHNDIEKFDFQKAEQKSLELMQKQQQKEQQITNINQLRELFLTSLKKARKQFNYALESFSKFDKFIELFDKSLFFRKYKTIEIRDFNKKIVNTRKLITDLTIQEQEVEKTFFFNPLLVKINQIFLNLIDLFDTYTKMEEFFLAEKIRNENLFLILLNIASVLVKTKNEYLQQLFQKDFEKAQKLFIELKKKQMKGKDKEQTFVREFSYLIAFIDNLKNNIENIILLRKTAEHLLVKANKYRFINDFFKNKILNIEILFVKQQYKTVIEKLIEILKDKVEPWMSPAI